MANPKPQKNMLVAEPKTSKADVRGKTQKPQQKMVMEVEKPKNPQLLDCLVYPKPEKDVLIAKPKPLKQVKPGKP